MDKKTLLKYNGCEFKYVKSVNSPGKIFETHCHSEYEVICVLGGNIVIAAEDKQFFLSAGSVAFISPTTYHSLFSDDETEYERIAVLFPQAIVPNQILSDFERETVLFPVKKTDELLSVCKKFKSALKADGEKFAPLDFSILTELIYEFTFAKCESGTLLTTVTDKSLQRVMEYVNGNLSKKLTIDEIADSVFLSKSTICHLVKQKLKISLKQYVLQKKIYFADGLIKSGTPVMEAAKAVGFVNYANFYSAYRKITGVKPSSVKQ